MSNEIQVRFLIEQDIPTIVSAFGKIGWNKPTSLFEKYLKEVAVGERLVWVAFADNKFAGYVTLKWQSLYLSFREQNIPEIMDLNVLPHARKIGIGSKLLDVAEKEALTKSSSIGIGVGLYAGIDGGYGAAARLYVINPSIKLKCSCTKSKNFLNFSKGDKCECLFLTYCIRNIEDQLYSK